MKKNRSDKPVGVTIHIYMEISQENFLCSYLYLKQAKMREQEDGMGPAQGGGLVPVGGGSWQGKGVRG
jgi:hypothetical protein